MRFDIRTGILFLIILLFPTDAIAAVHTICAYAEQNYTDNDYGEDTWTTDSAKALAGIEMRVRHYPDCASSGTSGSYTELLAWDYSSSAGCRQFTSNLVSTCFLMSVISEGEVSGANIIKSYDDSGSLGQWNRWFSTNANGGSYQINVGDYHRLRIYGTLAYVIENEFRGSLSGTTLKAYTTDSGSVCGCGSSTSTGNRWCSTGTSTGNICLTTSGRERKFLMAHEYGHHNLRFTAGSYIADCSFDSGNCSGSHCMEGREYSSCAMMEGWANFVAADAWNLESGSNPGGKLRYWGSCEESNTIDIESSGDGANCVVAYMEANWSSGSWPGYGTELDWMRALWDFHTNSSPGSFVSHSDLEASFAGQLPAGSSDKFRGYDMYRQGVADAIGCEQYERLVYMADANGADHCANEGSGDNCENVVGCIDVD